MVVRKLKLGPNGYEVFATVERIPATDPGTSQQTARALFAKRGERIVHEETGRFDVIDGEMHELVLIFCRDSDVYYVCLYGRRTLAQTDHEAELKQIVASLKRE